MNNYPPAIHIVNASLHYANKLLFERLSLMLRAGQTTCLLGPSGIGKSSLLRFIAGLLSPEIDKHIRLTGYVAASDGKPLQNRMAYLAQADTLLPWLTVLQNVMVGNKLRGTPVQASQFEQAKQLLQTVGLGHAFGLKPQQLSGGMRRRVALARILFENNPIVLLDEPFTALDTLTRLRLQDLTAKLLADKTVLLITHDPLEALTLGHQIYVMNGQPATLSNLAEIPGKPPRQLDDEALLHWQAILLQKLKLENT